MKSSYLFIVSFLCMAWIAQKDFISQQREFPRVRTAIKEKKEDVIKVLNQEKITLGTLNIILVAYKEEGKLDIYAKNKSNKKYKKMFSYDICSKSGHLGPKIMEGDGQVPEGFYHIDRFNPNSGYYLSLGINYPNLADKRSAKSKKLGGNIFIHGSCVTVGCLPMTDDLIKEIYVLALYAYNQGQSRIPVYMFPYKMTDANFKNHVAKIKEDEELITFWETLKTGFDHFQDKHTELNFSVDTKGKYIVNVLE